MGAAGNKAAMHGFNTVNGKYCYNLTQEFEGEEYTITFQYRKQ